MQIRKFFYLLGLVALVGAFSIPAAAQQQPFKFKVRIENISDANGQTATNGAKWPFALSPGMFLVHKGDAGLFQENAKASAGLEMQAEDGNPSGLLEMLANTNHASAMSGVYNTPAGANGPGPIVPGGSYEFTFTANAGQRLSMALMFGQSNDLFYAPKPEGIKLFSQGRAVVGDVTKEFILWDAGTEVNEEEGVGPNQAPRQAAPNTGAAEGGVVTRAKKNRFYNQTSKLFRVTISAAE